MPVEVFTEIIEKIHAHTSYVYLHVKGEPLLHPHLSELLDICQTKNMRVVLVTNGTLLAQKGDMLLSKPALQQVNISMHCISELNHVTNKTEYVKAVIDFAKKAVLQSQIYLSFRLWNFANTESENHPDNHAILHEIEHAFAPGLNLKEAFKPGKGLKLTDKLYLNSDVEFAWPSINDTNDNPNGFCYALRDHIAILNDGTVIPCCLDAGGEINLGNILENSLSNILNSERVQRMYHAFSDNKRIEALCRKCRFGEKFE